MGPTARLMTLPPSVSNAAALPNGSTTTMAASNLPVRPTMLPARIEVFDELQFQREFYASVIEIYKYHLYDHWRPEQALALTARDINRPLFYVRRIVERESRAA